MEADIEEKEEPSFLELKNIGKNYVVDNEVFPALKSIDLSLPKTGFIAILGPSGCGKTTLLNLIGGLDHPTSGQMLIDGKDTSSFSSKEWDNYRNKRVGFVFQSYNLIPHLNVLSNVETPLELSGLKGKQKKEKAKAALQKVGLIDIFKKKPNQLSGGQAQRVAIARAIVNDPDLILADEPTGALDSKTSIEVLDKLQEIAKTTCVIMVTHNKEYAEKYATRIIEMRDGEIVSDFLTSNQIKIEKKEAKIAEKKKISAGFAGIFKNSFHNILNKKTRSAITAIACSFGVIGVALVLAVSNGFNEYVAHLETNIAASVPISIYPTEYSYTSSSGYSGPAYPDDGIVHAYDRTTESYVRHKNNFSYEYIDYLKQLTDNPECPAYGAAMSVLLNRQDLDFHFITHDGGLEGEDGTADNQYIKVDQYASAGSLGSSISSVTGLPATVLHELYGGEKELADLYDVVAGKFPTKANELVLIVDQYNRVDFSTLKRLGVYSSYSTYASLTEDEKSISFDDIIYSGESDTVYKQYKCFVNSQYYDLSEVRELSMRCYEITGFDKSTATFSGTDVDENGDPLIKKMKVINSPASNSAGYQKLFESEDKESIDCHIVGVLRPTRDSQISLMPTSLAYTTALKEIMIKDYEAPSEQNGFVAGPSYELGQYQKQNYCLPVDENEAYDGLATLNRNVKTLLKDGSISLDKISASAITNLLNGAMRYYGVAGRFNESSTVYSYSSAISTYLYWTRIFGGDFDSVTPPSFEESAINEWIDLLTSPDFYANTAKDYLAYFNAYSLITSILVFPSNLNSKTILREYLDKWNEGKSDVDRITYNDVMSGISNTVAMLMDTITTVLVIFASVSLVVSTAMMAIVMYVSVIERKKEIGILRACGGRKADVGRLFESESVIIGAFSGLIGIGLGYLLCVPVNAVVSSIFPRYGLNHIASFHPLHALILFAVSVALAFISGLIPARIAARKDPVECLRSE